ncbi:DNA alkylation repair protein [archaeon]|jgi:3-methyladenine DNA glycosylase AlkD|nr:DNA alkylation repair protein [archaeon]
MAYKLKRQFKRLGNKQFTEDIKTFIKSSHDFYSEKVPELKTLAKRLHQEHTLKKFYPIFNKLWKSGYQGEKSLAIHTLQLYKEEFNSTTWKFIKPKLKDIKSWGHADSFGKEILGNILLKIPSLDKEIINMSKSKNLWIKRMAIMSTFPSIRQKQKTKLAIYLAENYLKEPHKEIQKAIGLTIKEISLHKPEIAKKFILKHKQMPETTFKLATENLKELRKTKKIKKLGKNNGRWFFWKNIR